MVEAGVDEGLKVALANAAVLAVWPTLPGLFLGYVRLALRPRYIRPAFSLQRSEAGELDRALLLYEKVCCHLNEIRQRESGAKGRWQGVFKRWAACRRQDTDEVEDLQAHAFFLRAIIIQLKRQPLRRLRSWLHVRIWRFALGGAVMVHAACFMLLMFALQTSQADQLITGTNNPLSWYPFDEHLFYANAAAAAFVFITAPLFFVVRRAQLFREYSLELLALKEFADADLDLLVDQQKTHPAIQNAAEQAEERDHQESNWFKILHLSHSATIEEVKESYKTLIKQNHPDRVHGMSSAFKKLAEAETKKLNAAYQHALFCIPSLERKDGREARVA